MVKAVAEPERVTPAAAALVTFWPTITPEMGAYTLTMLAGMVLVDAESLQLLFGGSQIGLRVLLRVFGLLQHGLRDGAVLEEVLGAEVCLVGELLVVDGLQIGVEGVGDVGALHA